MDLGTEDVHRSSAESLTKPKPAATGRWRCAKENDAKFMDNHIPLRKLDAAQLRTRFMDDGDHNSFHTSSISRRSSLHFIEDSTEACENVALSFTPPNDHSLHTDRDQDEARNETNLGEPSTGVRCSTTPTVPMKDSLYEVSVCNDPITEPKKIDAPTLLRKRPQLSDPETTSSHWDDAGHNVRPGPTTGASSAVDILGRPEPVVRPKYFVSRRVRKEDIQRPWLEKRDPREKWLTIIPCLGVLVGFCIAAFLVWDGMRTVINHSYCLVFDDDFTDGLDPSVWTKEAEVGGFGNGQFEQTTIGDENVYVDAEDGSLTFRPTLQDPNLISQNATINLTQAGICSSNIWSDCVATTNTTNGTIVNPVKSARISTRKGPHIKYGRVEVTATLPIGDWLWPAIWMLPVNETYGPWPQSGEIDIMESRGNNYTYPLGGNNIMSSTLHWGPSPATDAWWRSCSERTALHSTYAEGPHIFGIEWSEKYIFTYVDNRLLQVLYFDFRGDLWAEGDFPPADANGTRFVDLWSQTGRPSTPFDENFYLIINLAIGATNGWFVDGVAGKPWVDASKTARREFWDAEAEWYPTWVEGGVFKVHRVQMWQQQGYNGCLEG